MTIQIRRRHGVMIVLAVVISNVLALTGCKPDLTTPPDRDLNTTLWTLTLNHHAVLLSTSAPYDTVQLVATPRNVYGAELQGMPSVVYTALDTTIRLSETGLVRASSATTAAGARVVAKISDESITQVDTVYIQIRKTTSTPSPPRTFMLVRTDADSTKAAIGGGYVPTPGDTAGFGFITNSSPTFAARVTDTNGDVITPFAFFTSSDNTIAAIDRSTGAITMIRTGTVRLYGTSYIYGTILRDSIDFTVKLPLYTSFWIGDLSSTNNRSTRVSVGAVIDWWNSKTDSSSFDVIFENPASAMGLMYGNMVGDSGNIIGLGRLKHGRRVFLTPGIYPFRILVQPPIVGSIEVVQE